MVGAPFGLGIGAPGYQLTRGARGESVVLCSVCIQLYGTLRYRYIVILGQIPNKTVFFSLNGYRVMGLQGPMTGPAIQPIHPGAGADGTTDCTPFGAFRRVECHDWSAKLTNFYTRKSGQFVLRG